MTYIRLKMKLGKQVCFDKWFNNVLVHYNYYTNSIEIKEIQNNIFVLLYSVNIRPFMKIDSRYKNYIKNCL